jgi:predicted dehydrogenase/threonine dehydrogenase-like Zn-dependent dehydrogenase
MATHAEYNAVPRNLVVPVPAGVSLETASSAAVGAIALQAIRQARLELGESVAVIGLGLLGQILVQLCRANGCRVVGVDLDQAKCDRALQNGAEAACHPEMEEALHHAFRVSAGHGVDCVLLTVATKENTPIELAATLVRDRGRVLCLGNTHIELDWRTWFGKEIDFVFSRAMGAGMYDPDYFQHGKDYPIGYVRWSANRNMAAFLDLLAQGRLDMDGLITHRFPFNEAPAVFDRIANGDLASAVGVVFSYPDAEVETPAADARVRRFAEGPPAAEMRLGVIGAGNYLKSMIMPHLRSLRGSGLVGICTAKGANAEALARRYGFRYATTDAAQLIADPDVNAVVVGTRHDSHARYAAEALRAGKNVYVEKPLALTAEQLRPVIEALSPRSDGGPTLWLGHNRRYAPLTRRMREHFRGIEVRQVTILVRSAGIPTDSWYHDPVEGGGVLFGDVCHFVDLAIWLAQSAPVDVQAFATPDPGKREEAWAVQLSFASGGLATLHYTCGSQTGQVREVVEVLGGGRAARLEGFRTLVLRGGGAPRRTVRLQADLGQKAMLEEMTAQFRREAGALDQTETFVLAAQALLAVQRSILDRRVIRLSTRFPFAPDEPEDR